MHLLATLLVTLPFVASVSAWTNLVPTCQTPPAHWGVRFPFIPSLTLSLYTKEILEANLS